MSIRMFGLLLAIGALAVQAQSQAPLPADIHPVTLSRLPPVTPADLDEAARRLFEARENFTAGPGPTHVTVYVPRERTLGIPTGENSPVGPRLFQLAVLIAAREIDQQYEWSAHEPAGLRQGLEQSVIDVVKYDRAVAGLADKDATLIAFGRSLLRDNKVSSELWAEDGEPVRPPEHDRPHRDHGRLHPRRHHDECRQSAATGEPAGIAPAVDRRPLAPPPRRR